MTTLPAWFAADGPLARQVAGYAPRAGQAELAEAIGRALQQGTTLVAEAGTGTGKTFAYLVPALLSGGRMVISTGTLNLQDQLFHRDLPRVRAALDLPVRVTLLKGRANYLCRLRLDQALQSAPRADVGKLRQLQEWTARTDTGEVQEAGVLGEDDPLLPRVTSTAENCLGPRCAEFERCFVVKARRDAQAADVVVANHHLLFADFSLKEEGFGQILPGVDAVIVDEAHQLPELATRFFGTRVSTRQIQELLQDCAAEAAALGDLPELRAAAAAVAEPAARLETCFPAAGAREHLAAFLARGVGRTVFEALQEALAALAAQLEPVAERTPTLGACRLRVAELCRQLQGLREADGEERVAWVEPGGRGGSFHTTPIRVDGDFQRLRETHAGAWIFTSATLATGDDFSHFCNQLGLGDAARLKLDSPFDFGRQARLYLPRGLPDPNDPAYTERVVGAALPVIEASGGGAFLLCTSHRAVREAARRLRDVLPLPLLVQGEASRQQLLADFTRAGDAVLVGTSSFWEGVDVRGLALRVVIIDKLPFAAPGDPVFEARLAAIRAAGGDPFTDHQVPQAIMALRQGAGRLIRDPGDRGLLMLCDPRLRSRPYGARILASLPPMPVIEQLAEACAWLQQIRQAA